MCFVHDFNNNNNSDNKIYENLAIANRSRVSCIIP